MKKHTRFLMRQTSPVITIARQVDPCCIITFSLSGSLLALSYTGYIDSSQEYIIVAEAWRFVQKSTQVNVQPREKRTKRRNTETASII